MARPHAFLLLLATALALPGCGSSGRAHHRSSPVHKGVVIQRLAARRLGALPAPVQLPAAAPSGGGQALVMGGLDASDVSAGAITEVLGGRSHPAGSLPTPVHDAAAVGLAGRVYQFGGGLSSGSSSDIVRLSPQGRAQRVGRLPVPASDVAAAVVDRTAYVVGGYTGTQPMRSIVAFRPGGAAHAAGTLPAPLRYAAVAAVGGRVLVAGGTDGNVLSRDILSFDPRSRRVRRLGSLPVPLAHASAAALDGAVFVIGGRTTPTGGQTASILRIDPAKGIPLPPGGCRDRYRTPPPPPGAMPSPCSEAETAAAGRAPTSCGWSRAGEAGRGGLRACRRRGGRGLLRVGRGHPHPPAPITAPGHHPRQAPAGARGRLRRRPPQPAGGHGAPRPAARLRAQLQERHGGRDRPAHPQDRGALPNRGASPARDPLVGPQAAVGDQRHGQQPHPRGPA